MRCAQIRHRAFFGFTFEIVGDWGAKRSPTTSKGETAKDDKANENISRVSSWNFKKNIELDGGDVSSGLLHDRLPETINTLCIR